MHAETIATLIPSIALLTLLLPHSSESGCLGNFLKRKCGKNVKYISDFEIPNKSRKICLDKNKFESSPLSKIYSGWFSDDDQEDKRRFAIKKYRNAELAYRNSVKIFRLIKEIPNEAEQRLLITAVDWGHNESILNKEAVIVMELAGENFYSRLKRIQPDFNDDQSIGATIRLLAQPLEFFHREVGIHLDVKPGNFLYDQTGKFLKLIDFDGSRAFPPDNDDVPMDERANADIELSQPMVATVVYMSPEQLQSSKVSTKSDIWSLGISIYVALLLQRRYGLDEEKIRSALSSMTLLFRELPFSAREEAGRIFVHLDTLEVLFKIWNDFPATFQLLNNLLNLDPAARMSAKGVVNYTNGGCRPKMRTAEGNDDDDIVLFGHVTASSLQKINPRNYVDTATSMKVLEMQELLAQILSKQLELMANTNYGRLPECQTN